MISTAITNTPPTDLSLLLLTDVSGPVHVAARQFCLDVIKEFYGFDYRPDWHADLDSLLCQPHVNHYSMANRGAFWVLLDNEGLIQATAGIRHLGWKPAIAAAFADRYGSGRDVASLWRVYVKRELRRQGLGRWLNAYSEREASARGFAHMYLHASADAKATLGFWKASGYQAIGEFGDSVHFDKPLKPVQLDQKESQL